MTVGIACPGRGAARNEVERCTADPGSPRTGTVPGLQRTTSCCAAPGTRERRAFWRDEPKDHFAIRSSPRRRGTHDHRRWLWVPALAALGRDDDRFGPREAPTCGC